MPRAVSYREFYSRPAPESEDDLEVPGQPYLGLLGIISEYYKYREPNHKQGRVLGNALRYLYRVKKNVNNGAIDENFGLEIMNAVNEVLNKETGNKKPVAPSKTEASTSMATPTDEAPSSSTAPTPENKSKEPTPINDFSDFGFSSSNSEDDELGSKIDSIVRMVKSTVKKKKRKKHREAVVEANHSDGSDNENIRSLGSIPRIKIKLGCPPPSSSSGRGGENDVSPCHRDGAEEEGVRRVEGTPMKLKIKLGSPPKEAPLLPPPPLLTKHESRPDLPDAVPEAAPLSPKYEPSVVEVVEDGEEVKPAIKLTLRVGQGPKSWGSPHPGSSDSKTSSPAYDSLTDEGKALPEPPRLKPAPSSYTEKPRKRKRVESPRHPSGGGMLQLTKPPSSPQHTVPPLKIPKMCAKVAAERAKVEWDCGIFSNSLKLDQGVLSCDEIDFRSNILPIYCGINYMKKKADFELPYDIFIRKENKTLPKRVKADKGVVKVLEEVLSNFTQTLPELVECEYAFEEEERKEKEKRRKRKSNKKSKTGAKSETNDQTPQNSTKTDLQSPDGSPGLVIQSDCESPVTLQHPLTPNSNCIKSSPNDPDFETYKDPTTVKAAPSDIEKHDLVYSENRINTDIAFRTSPPKETPLLKHSNHSNHGNPLGSTCL